MTEWWTYRLEDFLMFSPTTYARLLEQYHRDVWPAQALGLIGGVTALVLTTRSRERALRLQAALLALAFLWVAWAFHLQRYSTINWAATYLALAFAVQAALLLALGLSGRGEAPTPNHRATQLGWVLSLAGLVFYPLAGVLAGLPSTRIEVFGVSPEPTALAGLGLMLARPDFYRRRWHAALLVIPLASLAVGAATLVALTA